MLVIWVIGLPVVGFLIIKNYKNSLDSDDVIFKFRILYQGYKKEAYYWEFVNTFRKVVIVMINVFLAIYPPVYKTFVATLILTAVLRYQESVKPYKIKIMNDVEFRESTSSIITLFGGIIFIVEDLAIFPKVLLCIGLLVSNLWFYTLWLHVFFKNSKYTALRGLALFLGKLSCLSKEYWDEEKARN